MLGILILFLFIYFVGNRFYELAHEYGKNKWLYAILGVVSYYAGAFLSGFLIGFFLVLMDSEAIDTTSEIVFNLLSIPFGILACWGLYQILKSKWKREHAVNTDAIEDIGKPQE